MIEYDLELQLADKTHFGRFKFQSDLFLCVYNPVKCLLNEKYASQDCFGAMISIQLVEREKERIFKIKYL